MGSKDGNQTVNLLFNISKGKQCPSLSRISPSFLLLFFLSLSVNIRLNIESERSPQTSDLVHYSRCPSCSSCASRGTTSWCRGRTSPRRTAPGRARLCPRPHRRVPGRRCSRRSPGDSACGHISTRYRPQDCTAPLGNV